MVGTACGATGIGYKAKGSQQLYNNISHLYPNDLEGFKNYLDYSAPNKVAAYLFEPLQGYGGIYPLKDNYLLETCKLIKEKGGLIISDEIQTGFGRLGET